MTDNAKQEDENRAIIKANFQKMLLAIGQQISTEFSVNAQKIEQMAPEELKPVVREGKKLFKSMLGKMFNAPQLEALSSVFNKPFLESMKEKMTNSTHSKDRSWIELGIQVLMQLGVPMLQNLIAHAKPSHPNYHPTHSSPSEKPASTILPRGQVGREVKAQYHRMTSGNRGK
jgi:hypothetical protein